MSTDRSAESPGIEVWNAYADEAGLPRIEVAPADRSATWIAEHDRHYGLDRSTEDAPETWRDDDVVSALREGRPLGSFGRQRLLEMIEEAAALSPSAGRPDRSAEDALRKRIEALRIDDPDQRWEDGFNAGIDAAAAALSPSTSSSGPDLTAGRDGLREALERFFVSYDTAPQFDLDAAVERLRAALADTPE